jgi:hypothetical protein
MIAMAFLFICVLCDCFKSRRRLEAEIRGRAKLAETDALGRPIHTRRLLYPPPPPEAFQRRALAR